MGPLDAGTIWDGYEVILLPVVMERQEVVLGGHGSIWTGDLWASNRGNHPQTNLQLTSRPQTTVPANSIQSIGGLDRWQKASLVYLADEDTADVSFGAFLREHSRAIQPQGVALPVVREAEFLRGVADILGIPIEDGRRLLLRLYDTVPTVGHRSVVIQLLDEDGHAFATSTVDFASDPAWPLFPGEPLGMVATPGYAQVDITQLLGDTEYSAGVIHVRLNPSGDFPYWAMVSATDNQSQHVLIMSPQ